MHQINVPVAVLSKLPQRTKTMFFGVARIGLHRSDVFLHVYTIPNPKISAKYPDPKVEFLDLLQRQPFSKKAKQGETFRRLNRIDLMTDDTLPLRGNDDLPEITRLSIIWLQPKQRRGPIIVPGDGVPDGGDGWSEVFLTFPKGLSGKPAFQIFGGGNTLSTNADTIYNGADKRGYIAFTEDDGDITGNYYFIHYSWTDKGFVGHKQ